VKNVTKRLKLDGEFLPIKPFQDTMAWSINEKK